MQKSPSTTTTNTTASLPSYAQPAVTDFFNKAQTAANLPYTANPNQQVADQSAATTQANSMIGGIAAAGTPSGITDAQNTVAGISAYKPQSVLDADMSKYMNPYVQQSIDVQKAQATRDFQQQQGQRDTAAVQAGAFGGDRATIANGMAQQNLNTNLQGIEATGLNTAYNNAAQLFQNDQTNALQGNQLGINAANAEGNLASQGNSIQLQNAAALSGVGTQQQQQQQNVLNAQNTQWTAQNQYPVTQADLYSKLLNGSYSPQTSTSTTTPPPSLLSQIAGTVAAGIGAYGSANTPGK